MNYEIFIFIVSNVYRNVKFTTLLEIFIPALVYNLGQKVGDKFTKLSKIGFSMEFFTTDILQCSGSPTRTLKWRGQSLVRTNVQ